MFVRLRVGAEAYALPVECVLEVAELGDVTEVPGSDERVLGVRNLRGEVLPVFDLARLLGIGQERRPEHLVVLEASGARVGLAIHGITSVGPLPEAVGATDAEFVAGAALADGELVGIIDVPRVLEALGRRD